MHQEVPFEEALRVWLAGASIPQKIRLLEIIKEELRRQNLILEYHVTYEIPER
jgi:hypothetical protein